MGTVTREALLSRATTTLVLPAWSEEAHHPPRGRRSGRRTSGSSACATGGRRSRRPSAGAWIGFGWTWISR
jgi:hypothetical protein